MRRPRGEARFVFRNNYAAMCLHFVRTLPLFRLPFNTPMLASGLLIELETDAEIISDGEVPCKYSSKYSSVMGDGTAIIVEDVKEKIFGLRLLMKNQTGRDFEISENMTKSVAVLRIDVSYITAKSRTAGGESKT